MFKKINSVPFSVLFREKLTILEDSQNWSAGAALLCKGHGLYFDQ